MRRVSLLELAAASLLIWLGAVGLHWRGFHAWDSVFVTVGSAVVVVGAGYRLYQYVRRDVPESDF